MISIHGKLEKKCIQFGHLYKKLLKIGNFKHDKYVYVKKK